MTPALRAVLSEADALLRRNAPDEARSVLETAARAEVALASIPEYFALLGHACQNGGDHSAALAALTAALDGRPRWPQVLHLRALALRDLGRLDHARADVVAALALRADDPRAWTTLGTIEARRAQLDEARAAFERALEVKADHSPAWRGLGETLQAAGAIEPALGAWRRWLHLSREEAGASALFGAALARAHRWEEAESVLASAAAAPDATPETFVRLAHVRAERGDATGALATFSAATTRWPLSLTPFVATNLFLPQVYASAGDVASWRDRYAQGLATLEAALPALVAQGCDARDLDWTNFYLAYQGENDLALQRRYAAFVSELAAAAGALPPPRASSSRIVGRSRPRVGFASSFFHACTVGAYFGAWPQALDRARFEIFIFHYGPALDATTDAIRSKVEHFIRAPSRVRAIAGAIRAADLDVLVYPQLGMDGSDVTLATLRLSPLQCVAWGHPETTGSAAIDAFISVDGMEPGDAAAHYSERLLRLPGIGTCYARPAVRAATRGEFGLPTGARLYACPQSLFKIHPENDAMLAGVLAADAAGMLVACGDWQQPAAMRFRARVTHALDERGIDPSRLLLQPLRAPGEFRAMLSTCDIMVDTTRWSGGNTALDALAAGLPIVASEGILMRGRQSAAMLRQIGLADLVVASHEPLSTRAVAVASEATRYRQHVLAHLGALFDREEPIAALADELTGLVESAQAGASWAR